MSPAFSKTNSVPGCICSGIHSVRTLSSWTIFPPMVLLVANKNLRAPPSASRTGSAARRLAPGDTALYAPYRIGEADGENRLARVLQYVDDVLRRGLYVNVGTICQQMYIGAAVLFLGVDGLHQPLAELALQEPQHLAHALQGKALAAKLPDNRDLRQIIERVQPPPAGACGRDDALLIPPLQLAARDAGKGDYLVRRETCHLLPCPISTRNVLNNLIE